MCADKGLGTLVDAFCILKQRGQVPDLRLRAAGVQIGPDAAYVRCLERKLESKGPGEFAEFRANISREEKRELLASLSVLSVPATYGESFGLYVLEAWSLSVPVVQPWR